MNWLLLACVVGLFAGCRSTDKFGADSFAEAEQSIAPETSLVKNSTTAAARPSYAQLPSADEMQGSQTKAESDSAIQLASAQKPTAPSVQIVPLRTLGVADNFQQIVSEAPGVVLVDFYADWCGPCRKQGKVLHELESFAAANQAQIVKVDVDQHKAIAKKYDVSSLPTLIVLKNGKVVDRKVGLTNESRLRSMMQ